MKSCGTGCQNFKIEVDFWKFFRFHSFFANLRVTCCRCVKCVASILLVFNSIAIYHTLFNQRILLNIVHSITVQIISLVQKLHKYQIFNYNIKSMRQKSIVTFKKHNKIKSIFHIRNKYY